MILQLSKALSNGFNTKQVIDFLMKKFPEHQERIQTALATGFTVDQILSFLSGGKKALNKMEEEAQGTTDYEKTRGADVAQRENINNKAVGLGALAATSLAAPMAATALQRALPNSLKSMTPSLTGALQQQTQQSLSQQPPVLPNATSVTQPQVNAQPQVITNPKEYLEKLGIKDKVDDLLKRGNSPEQAATALGMKSGIGKLRSEIDPELLANIDAYSKEKLRDEAMQPEGSLPIAKKEVIQPVDEFSESEDKKAFAGEKATDIQKRLKIGLPQAQRLIEERDKTKPISKSELVATPHGVGEVREIRNGQAIIDVDGKLHKVKEEELEGSPLPEKDLAELHDDLIKGIEGETGEDVSRMVQWAGYNPSENTLTFLPHTGKLYKYKNISPEDAALLRDILSVRKTSGENFIGAWKAGSKSPIGAALSKLIRKLQAERGGKGNEYEETHEPIYSAYEPAIQAKKKKKKK